ncbi:sensor histidine kinase [Ralstonia solanacearum]|uniref:histidine kinase n=2 Tax=Ralstonia solanacearum TaxID=305 RepID=F6G5X1_RALS8|nr:sensor histidine kinase [Ralstonia solanacearum]AEG67387.1 sensory histidine kinase [Ralstonia solanacearum Po82]AMP68804.1 histidine kinase [Ralstonia solanacearum]AMP74291.1 histidine kinase [Ralstonia solanacearum]MBB6585917.1 sensor histidine kinase N-terminal domain-containing protein [Ralstonia solanacearum]MCG3576400.1 sensor histidine kinase N-terminal domain-containing protein [Ralstonia solanacearum]
MFKRHRPAASSSPASGANHATSLRLHLLRALAAPLFGLVVGTGALSYWLAAHYTAQVFDRALVGVANALAGQLRLAGPHVNATQIDDIALAAQTLVQSSGEDRVYWRIAGPSGTLAGREAPLGYGSGQVHMGEARVFYSWLDGKQVRAVHLLVPGITAEMPWPRSPHPQVAPEAQNDVTRPALAPTQAQTARSANPLAPPDAVQPEDGIVIEVAELLDRRELAAKEVLLSVSIPLIVLLAVGGLILMLVLKEELQPLQTLADTLNRQSAQSVTPLPAESAERVPAELQPLINAMNALLARLRDALEAQRTFIADAAHQLRTPLTALKLHADRAVDAKTLEEARPALLELQAGANRAVRLSNQLLTLARAEHGMTLDQLGPPTRLDLVALAFDTGAEWVPRALAQGLDLGFEAWPPLASPAAMPPVPVLGNIVLLREAIGNLLDNAIKYVPPGGRVTLRAGIETETGTGAAADAQAGRLGIVCVEDNGPGIPSGRRAEVFQRFFRGDADHRLGQPQGSGLGLAIVHDIVRLHGGTVAIDDAIARDGAQVMRFVLRLPLADARA